MTSSARRFCVDVRGCATTTVPVRHACLAADLSHIKAVGLAQRFVYPAASGRCSSPTRRVLDAQLLAVDGTGRAQNIYGPRALADARYDREPLLTYQPVRDWLSFRYEKRVNAVLLEPSCGTEYPAAPSVGTLEKPHENCRRPPQLPRTVCGRVDATKTGSWCDIGARYSISW